MNNYMVTIIFLLLVMLPWPLWRLVFFEAYRAFQSPTPAFQILVSASLLRGRVGKLLCGLGTYLIAVFSTLYFLPATAYYLLAIGIFFFIVYLVRAQTKYGERSRLPPGNITFLPIEPALEEKFYLQKREQFGPIFKIGSPPDLRYLSFRPLICIVDLQLGQQFLRKNDNSLRSEPEAPFSMQFEAGDLRDMSQEDHRKYRKPHHTAYANLDPEYLNRVSLECAQEALLKMEASSKGPLGSGVDPRPFFDKMMFGILSEILFGIHRDSPYFQTLMTHVSALELTGVTRRTRGSIFRPKLQKAMNFLREYYHSGKSLDFIPKESKSVLDHYVGTDANSIFDDNVLCNLLNDFWSGRIDTTGLLTWTTKFLTDTNGEKEISSLKNLDGQTAEAKFDDVVKEVLRLSQSEWLLRRVISDIEFENFKIPKGWNVRICVREAHRLTEKFNCPNDFQPSRFDGALPSITEYAPFGLYKHMCVGAHISHAASRALISSLVNDFVISSTQDGPLIHMWLHWAPSPYFKVAVSRKQLREI